MNQALKLKVAKKMLQFSPFKFERLDELLSLMNNHKQVSGMLLGGSISYKDDFEKADIDLFFLINNVEKFEKKLKKNLSQVSDIDEVIFQGNYPWTGKLYTVYFKHELDFSIDLCLIDFANMESFFWEPDGFILFDKEGTIENIRNKQINSPSFTRQPFLKSNPFSLAIITLKKIEKNLSRNHLWNALEQLNILRRYIMQIIRLEVVKHDLFLGRVDRDIEDIIPPEINSVLSKTTALYDKKDIAQKSILLIKLLLEQKEILNSGHERNVSKWILKQLTHESVKLHNYF